MRACMDEAQGRELQNYAAYCRMDKQSLQNKDHPISIVSNYST